MNAIQPDSTHPPSSIVRNYREPTIYITAIKGNPGGGKKGKETDRRGRMVGGRGRYESTASQLPSLSDVLKTFLFLFPKFLGFFATQTSLRHGNI